MRRQYVINEGNIHHDIDFAGMLRPCPVCLTFNSLDSNFKCFSFHDALGISLVDHTECTVKQNVS